MNYSELLARTGTQEIEFPSLSPTGTVDKGTKITLKHITKFKVAVFRLTEFVKDSLAGFL